MAKPKIFHLFSQKRADLQEMLSLSPHGHQTPDRQTCTSEAREKAEPCNKVMAAP